MTPLLLGLSGLTITEGERALFKAADPAGFILFARNIDTPEQVRALTADLRALAGRDDLPILIDQEGGRVARLGPPHWPLFPPARRFGEVFGVAPVTAIEAARRDGRGFREAYGEAAQFEPVVARFFEEVFVMSDDIRLRQARLRLMKRLEVLILQLGDISEIVASE